MMLFLVFTGVDLGKAYDIPGRMKNSVFFASTCLKASIFLRAVWQLDYLWTMQWAKDFLFCAPCIRFD